MLFSYKKSQNSTPHIQYIRQLKIAISIGGIEVMEYDKSMCPVVGVNGFISSGKQYDVDIHLPEDNRSVIYGVIKDSYDEPVSDAVVKLIELEKDGKKIERKPVTHTFTDKQGQFVFGPLCANKFYEIEIWANKVKHHKICTTCHHYGKCLKGEETHCDKNEIMPRSEEITEE